MSFTTEKTATSYSIGLTTEQMLAIMDKDNNEPSIVNCLNIRLGDIDGVIDDVEYNGHFGPFIFVSIKDEYDNPETWEMIFQTINKYLGVL